MSLEQAIQREITWKGDEFRSFAVALVELALDELNAGRERFTTDIVPDERRRQIAANGCPGNGISGSVTYTLKSAHVIEPIGVVVAGKFYPDKEISKREGRNSSPIGVYRLTSRGLAEEFLRRHGSLRTVTARPAEPAGHQTEMFCAPTNVSGIAN
jgi:hypothetical protein